MIVFKPAMCKMTDIMQGVEDNWIIYEILMQHRNVLNTQIDLLIKQKKKIYESTFQAYSDLSQHIQGVNDTNDRICWRNYFG